MTISPMSLCAVLYGLLSSLCVPCRAELVAHYQALGQQADLRRVRAEWREARLALTSKRQQWLEGEGERWEKKEEKQEKQEEAEKKEEEEEEEEAKEERGVQNSTFERGGREDGMSVEHSPSPGEGGQLASPSAPATPSEDTLLETEQQQQQQSSVPALPREPSVPAPQASSGDASSSAVVSGASSASLPHARSTRGHAPPATIQDLIHPPADGAPVPHVQSSRGHTPPSTIQHLLYPLTSDLPTHLATASPAAPPLPPPGAPVPHVQSSRGHAPPSTIQHLLYPLTSDLPTHLATASPAAPPLPPPGVPVPHVQSSRGHAPPSTIQHLLYPLTSDLPTHLATASPAAPPLPPPGGWPASSEDPLHMPAPLPYTLDYPQLGQPCSQAVSSHVHHYTARQWLSAWPSFSCVATALVGLADELPQGDLLTPILGPIPVQSGVEADCLLLPLPSLLNHALSLPLLTQ